MDDRITKQLQVKRARNDNHQFPIHHGFQQAINDIVLALFALNLCIYRTISELIVLINWQHKNLNDREPNRST